MPQQDSEVFSMVSKAVEPDAKRLIYKAADIAVYESDELITVDFLDTGATDVAVKRPKG